MDSSEISGAVTGDIYALINYPFATVDAALNDPAHWCDILILHLNVKSCQAVIRPDAPTLLLRIGKKHDEAKDKAFPVEFAYRVAASYPSYLRIRLHAETGPFGTSNYQIAFDALPLESGRTFIHLAYSYDFGLTARLAMKGYLTTVGSGKVGFSLAEARPGGETALIGGVRGVVERNTMRYFLAIEAYLAALDAPPADQLDLRLHRWNRDARLSIWPIPMTSVSPPVWR